MLGLSVDNYALLPIPPSAATAIPFQRPDAGRCDLSRPAKTCMETEFLIRLPDHPLPQPGIGDGRWDLQKDRRYCVSTTRISAGVLFRISSKNARCSCRLLLRQAYARQSGEPPLEQSKPLPVGGLLSQQPFILQAGGFFCHPPVPSK